MSSQGSGLSDSERERAIALFFRERWKDDIRPKPSINTIRHVEYDGPSQIYLKPARKLERRSWMYSLRRSRADFFRSRHTSDSFSFASTSIRSPVNSELRTIYSADLDAEAQRQYEVQVQALQMAKKSQSQPSRFNELYTLAWLTFFSLLGTLARIGVETLTQYPDAPVTSRVLWANIGGSFFMGFLVEDRTLFGIPKHIAPRDEEKEEGSSEFSASVLKFKKTVPLYTGLTTGFCGSFTSFSSFIRDMFLAMSNALPGPSPTVPYRGTGRGPYPRNGGYSVEALLAILILHPALSLAALRTGAHVAILFRKMLPKAAKVITAKHLAILNPLFVIVGFGSFIAALVMTIIPPVEESQHTDWRTRALIPLLFAPVGCILRYYLAKWCNKPSSPNFPWGTFIANVFGTYVLGMAWDLQHTRAIGAVAGIGNPNVCAILYGVQEGFCGCLTTVSTWVNELSGIKTSSAWRYGLVSVSVSFAGMVAIMGSVGWTIGFANPVCG